METIITAVLGGLFGSSFIGFIQFMITRADKKKDNHSEYEKQLEQSLALQRDMLIGLGHDRIVYLGGVYIERGYITKDEYENLNDYLYLPYSAMGGNGTAKKVMEEVEKLPMKKKGE